MTAYGKRLNRFFRANQVILRDAVHRTSFVGVVDSEVGKVTAQSFLFIVQRDKVGP